MTKANELKIKEIPADLFRAFARVDSVDFIPIAFYDSCGIAEGDRASFKVKPADPVTNEQMRELVMTRQAIISQCADMNGLSMQDLALVSKEATTKAKREKKAKAIDSAVKANSAWLAEISTSENRAKVAKCIGAVNNYKTITGVDKEGKAILEACTDGVDEVLKAIPAQIVDALFSEIQKLSNLTDSEVLGV